MGPSDTEQPSKGLANFTKGAQRLVVGKASILGLFFCYARVSGGALNASPNYSIQRLHRILFARRVEIYGVLVCFDDCNSSL